ncbi:DUF1214 domain-containing protein [Nocardioides aestuarii]|uniref:DUF1214 domain-containing protein n=1 Tax=Nocardioides aestuarii TaxID=252231 RepID=A0ABW4TS91_9ACTN
MSDIRVSVDNFVRAETNRMFAGVLAANNVATNEWAHNRVPTPLDNQPVIRQNRDTLYSAVVVDISEGATLTIPEAQGRYLSAMVVNQDHYINAVLHDAGEHQLTLERFDTPFVVVAVRILVEPGEPDDVSVVTALQDQLAIAASSAEPFQMPAYEPTTFAETRDALIKLSEGLDGYGGAFGRRDEVDPIRHLIGTASAWGGLPEHEAFYQNVVPGLPVGAYTLTVRDVPVDGFWSVSLYDADGYFPTDTGGRVSVNNLTADQDPDGSVTIHFGGPEGTTNLLPIVEGWNYLVRYYQPRPEIIDGTWTLPAVTSVD